MGLFDNLGLEDVPRLESLADRNKRLKGQKISMNKLKWISMVDELYNNRFLSESEAYILKEKIRKNIR